MDKVILITGASSGIGEGIVRTLAATGAKLTLGASRTDCLAAIALGIRDAGAPSRSVRSTSLTAKTAQPSHRWQFILGDRIDVQSNNAGMMASRRFRWASMTNGIG